MDITTPNAMRSFEDQRRTKIEKHGKRGRAFLNN